MKQIYLIPNIITAFALSCGLFVIFKVNMVEAGPGLFTVLNVSALLLLVAAFADLLDGAVARAIRAESEFGMVFDSLAVSLRSVNRYDVDDLEDKHTSKLTVYLP